MPAHVDESDGTVGNLSKSSVFRLPDPPVERISEPVPHEERLRQLSVQLHDAAYELSTLVGPIRNAVNPPGTQAFADRLTRLIASRGVTQQTVAEAIGRTQTAVSYWATAKREPRLSDLCALAAYFNVTTDYLVGREQ